MVSFAFSLVVRMCWGEMTMYGSELWHQHHTQNMPETAKIKLERGGCPRAPCERNSGQGWLSVSLWLRTRQSMKGLAEVTRNSGQGWLSVSLWPRTR